MQLIYINIPFDIMVEVRVNSRWPFADWGYQLNAHSLERLSHLQMAAICLTRI